MQKFWYTNNKVKRVLWRTRVSETQNDLELLSRAIYHFAFILVYSTIKEALLTNQVPKMNSIDWIRKKYVPLHCTFQHVWPPKKRSYATFTKQNIRTSCLISWRHIIVSVMWERSVKIGTRIFMEFSDKYSLLQIFKLKRKKTPLIVSPPSKKLRALPQITLVAIFIHFSITRAKLHYMIEYLCLHYFCCRYLQIFPLS